MLAALGIFVSEAQTGVTWADAIAKEAAQPSYANLDLPFSIDVLAYINPILIGGAEIYRNSELDPERRCYPGGYFDPLKLASGDADPAKAFQLKEAEIKHARLAMVACLGFLAQTLSGLGGALEGLEKFSGTF